MLTPSRNARIRLRKAFTASLALALVGTACGSGTETNANGGVVREVLMDYKHDSFASSFLRYYPRNITVHPGDTVRFDATWTGEPHSVTMGTIIDKFMGFASLFAKYDSAEAALAGGVPQSTIDEVDSVAAKVPGMTGNGDEIYQPGARPCYVADTEDVPAFSTEDEVITDASANCPAGGEKQPAFNGRQALYNSGFIPFQGTNANTFELPIAKDAVPGTYNYFCNYHWTEMSGTVRIVPKTQEIPSQSAVTRTARKEIQAAVKHVLARVAKAEDGVKAPLAGLSTGRDNDGVFVNEFYPSRVKAKVGQPVTWTVEGTMHTVSFNVPKYFPVFTVGKDGNVKRDPKSYEAQGWTVPPTPEFHGDVEPGAARKLDVGVWDGTGGFHSSGSLIPGETFTVAFSKPGTYPFACVVHPPMIGTVVVT